MPRVVFRAASRPGVLQFAAAWLAAVGLAAEAQIAMQGHPGVEVVVASLLVYPVLVEFFPACPPFVLRLGPLRAFALPYPENPAVTHLHLKWVRQVPGPAQ